MDQVSEARLGEVHPELAKRVRQMATMLEQESIIIRCVQGFRSWKEQDDLWHQGRDADGNVIDKSKVVTNAPAGHSWHNLALAVDVCPFDNGLPDWDSNHPAWKRIVAVGESLGLVSGSKWRTFPDWPHFQITGKLPVSPDDSVRETFLNSGVKGVWAETGLDV